jgi:hypothetical protein
MSDFTGREAKDTRKKKNYLKSLVANKISWTRSKIS